MRMRHRTSKCIPMYGFHPNVADAAPAARAPSLIASVFPGRHLSRRLARCRVPRNRNIWVKTAQKRSRKACPRHASNRETSTDVSRETFGGLGWCHRSSAAPPGRNAAAKGGLRRCTAVTNPLSVPSAAWGLWTTGCVPRRLTLRATRDRRVARCKAPKASVAPKG